MRFSSIGGIDGDAALQAVLGDVSEPASRSSRGDRPVMSRPFSVIRPPVGRSKAGDDLDQLGLAVALHAGDAEHGAAAHLEGDVAQRGQAPVVDGVHALELEHDLARAGEVSCRCAG